VPDDNHTIIKDSMSHTQIQPSQRFHLDVSAELPDNNRLIEGEGEIMPAPDLDSVYGSILHVDRQGVEIDRGMYFLGSWVSFHLWVGPAPINSIQLLTMSIVVKNERITIFGDGTDAVFKEAVGGLKDVLCTNLTPRGAKLSWSLFLDPTSFVVSDRETVTIELSVQVESDTGSFAKDFDEEFIVIPYRCTTDADKWGVAVGEFMPTPCPDGNSIYKRYCDENGWNDKKNENSCTDEKQSPFVSRDLTEVPDRKNANVSKVANANKLSNLTNLSSISFGTTSIIMFLPFLFLFGSVIAVIHCIAIPTNAGSQNVPLQSSSSCHV